MTLLYIKKNLTYSALFLVAGEMGDVAIIDSGYLAQRKVLQVLYMQHADTLSQNVSYVWFN